MSKRFSLYETNEDNLLVFVASFNAESFDDLVKSKPIFLGLTGNIRLIEGCCLVSIIDLDTKKWYKINGDVSLTEVKITEFVVDIISI